MSVWPARRNRDRGNGVLRWFQSGIANGLLEGIDSLVQAAIDYDSVVEACCQVWNAMTAYPERLRSLTNYPWIGCVNV